MRRYIGIKIFLVLCLVAVIGSGVYFISNDYKSLSKNQKKVEKEEGNIKEVNVGEWVEVEKYSDLDEQYHPISFRVTGLLRGKEANKVIKEFNDTHNTQIGDLKTKDLEYCVITYEVQYSADYPQKEGIGIENPTLEFGIKEEEIHYNGVVHKGIKTVYDISTMPGVDEFYAGDLFTGGMGAFVMVENYDGFKVSYKYKDIYDEKNTIYINFK